MPAVQRPQPTPYDLLHYTKPEEHVRMHLPQEHASLATDRGLETTKESVTKEMETEETDERGLTQETQETDTPAPAPIFTRARGNDRQVFTVTRERPNLRRCQQSQCARPRKLVL